ncbi:putative inactive receptor kinase RLK902 [Senna tora]|uniref:Putative inactive receptor kinase RLK902 n=1 Tax=Senna tora TaxID=362788 RepID=A0A834WG85_9FABA|nr:putative inactive receptor kinase RLK902 [Senna tora]
MSWPLLLPQPLSTHYCDHHSPHRPWLSLLQFPSLDALSSQCQRNSTSCYSSSGIGRSEQTESTAETPQIRRRCRRWHHRTISSSCSSPHLYQSPPPEKLQFHLQGIAQAASRTANSPETNPPRMDRTRKLIILEIQSLEPHQFVKLRRNRSGEIVKRQVKPNQGIESQAESPKMGEVSENAGGQLAGERDAGKVKLDDAVALALDAGPVAGARLR